MASTLFIVWVITVTSLSLIPTPHVNTLHNLDKLVHLCIYFLTTVFYYFSFSKKSGDTIGSAIIFSIVLGIVIEVLQSKVPSRSFSFANMGANCGGALFGGLILKIRLKVRDA